MGTLNQRDRRALLILGAALAAWLLLQFGFPAGRGAGSVLTPQVEVAEKRLRRLQAVASQRPRAAAEAEAAARALAESEKGLLKAATPALASAEMQQILKDMLGRQGIGLQGSEFGPVKAVSEDYAQVPLTVGFNCGIDQWINLMAALRNAPQVLSSLELRIVPGDPKSKLVQVRMIVAGYIPASLLPGAKGTGAGEAKR